MNCRVNFSANELFSGLQKKNTCLVAEISVCIQIISKSQNYVYNQYYFLTQCAYSTEPLKPVYITNNTSQNSVYMIKIPLKTVCTGSKYLAKQCAYPTEPLKTVCTWPKNLSKQCAYPTEPLKTVFVASTYNITVDNRLPYWASSSSFRSRANLAKHSKFL